MKKYIALVLLITAIIHFPLKTEAARPSDPKLSNVLTTLSSLKSLNYTANASANISLGSSGRPESYTFGIDASGKLILSSKSPASDTLINVDALILSPLSALSAKISAEVIYAKENFYIQLKKLTSQSPEINMLTPYIKKYQKIWLKFAKREALDYADSDTLSDASQDSLIETVKKLEEAGILVFSKTNIISVINGSTANKYSLSINKNNLIKAYELKYRRSLTNSEKVSIEGPLNALTIVQSDLWVDVLSNLPVRYDFNFKSSSITPRGGDFYLFSGQILLGKINSVKNIKAPSKAKSFEDILNDILEGSMGSVREKAKDASTKANIVSMRPQAELYYDSHNYTYKNLCSDKMIIEALQNAKSNSGTTAQCNVSSNGTAYVISAKVSSGYYCVDNTGYAQVNSSPLSGKATSCSN
jgi:hypothetical protein